MIDSIIRRNNRLHPYNETQITIIQSAAKLFLQNGYTKTTIKLVERDSGVKAGNITYYFHSKEELFKVLVEELMDFHANMIEETHARESDVLFAYALEIAAQIALCENNAKAWDLYSAAYSLPQTYEHIKTWAAEKNYRLLKPLLPDWTERDFREKEFVASGIECAALKTACDRNFPLENKVSLILDSMLLLYGISEETRRKTIEKILKSNYEALAEEMFEKFVNRLDHKTKQET